jgi:hypothetical protein
VNDSVCALPCPVHEPTCFQTTTSAGCEFLGARQTATLIATSSKALQAAQARGGEGDTTYSCYRSAFGVADHFFDALLESLEYRPPVAAAVKFQVIGPELYLFGRLPGA